MYTVCAVLLQTRMGGCGSSVPMRMPKEKRFRRAIKLYEVAEVQSMTNVFNRNKCFESGDSPLTLAAQQGHEVIVESLLDAGADVNKLDGNGLAAIHVACQLNDLPTLKVKYLLSRKDKNEFANIKRIKKRQPKVRAVLK